MRRTLLMAALALLVGACETSPTGRQQLRLIPENQMAEIGAQAFAQLRETTPVVQEAHAQRYVRCVADAVTRHARPTQSWEVAVFQDSSANAFALPGGKIGVHMGMLDLAENQGQLAAVIGHEVAHVLAHHPNARVSLAYATDTALEVASAAAGDLAAREQIFGLLGLGAQYGVLMPYGRAQEQEADVVGLDLMARAGFDPREAIELWRRMSQASGGQPPEFLSTHPSHGHRIETLQANMSEALALYQEARSQGIAPECG